MKQVINITLGGRVFAIEQDAYDNLSVYLEEIKANLTESDDAKEIVGDIEAAIAEKFIARNRSEKLAVTSDDVKTIVSELGSPADFKDEAGAEAEPEPAATHAESTATTTATGPKKRLYRDTDDVVIAGVASGLANYFAIDPVIVRLLFVFGTLLNGFGIVVYVVLWLVVPKAVTTAEKYAMRGEQVTLREISERVKKNLDDIPLARDAEGGMRGVLDKLFRGFGAIVRFLVGVFRFVFGLLFIVFGALGLAAMVATYSIILLSEKVFFPHDVQVALDVLTGSALGIIAMVASFIAMAIPLLVFIIAGSSLIAKRNQFTVQKTVTLAVVWVIAAVMAGTASALQVEQVMQKVGPIEGRFNDDSFEILWERGEIYGNDKEVHIRYEDTVDGTKAYLLTDETGLVELEAEVNHRVQEEVAE